MSEATQQRSIVLILARDLASMLATPMLIVDAEGALIFYNEAAGSILGRPFNEADPRRQLLRLYAGGAHHLAERRVLLAQECVELAKGIGAIYPREHGRFLDDRHAFLLEENLGDLLGRAEVDLVATDRVVGITLRLAHLGGEVGLQPGHHVDVGRDAGALHPGQHLLERQLDVEGLARSVRGRQLEAASGARPVRTLLVFLHLLKRDAELVGEIDTNRHQGNLSSAIRLFVLDHFKTLAVGPTEHPEVSRMTIVVNVEESPLEQVTKQLNKLVEVIKIVELDGTASVNRELLLVKVKADVESRSRVLDAVALFKARVVDVASDAVTIEVTGNSEKLASFLKVVEPFGIRELVQSGMVAIGRGSRSVSERTLRPVPVPAPPARTG